MATLVVCGQGKLSDEVLAAALLAFYESKSAMPEGISKSAMTAWANKQAYALTKVPETGFGKLRAAIPPKLQMAKSASARQR